MKSYIIRLFLPILICFIIIFGFNENRKLILERLVYYKFILNIYDSYNDKIYDFEIKGICSIFNPSYDDFQSRVKMILSINNEEYLKKLDNDPNYYLNFDEKENIIDKIRSLINTNLN